MFLATIKVIFTHAATVNLRTQLLVQGGRVSLSNLALFDAATQEIPVTSLIH